MSFITRGILRWGLIGGLALGGVTLLVGPEHVAMGLSQIRSTAQNTIDNLIDDPVALRRQLAQLAEEYPDRIAEVESEIAAVDHQIAQFDHDVNVARLMVAMTTEDLQDLKTLVARAEAEKASNVRSVSNIVIRHEGVRYTLDEAYAEGRRISTVRNAAQDRLAADEVQVKFLQEQKARLGEVHQKLSTEYGTYQAKLWQLDRQIDSIQRNERLIELLEDQQATLANYDRLGKVQNLKQLESKLAELRTKQEAQLRQLEKSGISTDYEEKALLQLEGADTEVQMFDPFADIIEIGDTEDDTAVKSDDSVAFAGPIEIK